ncbi:MAG: hypothetical protein LBN29_00305 [Mediterranea sp.]|jgi:hypothetical protein|nr:hypothetical protein [Mediterranea sp.]
MKYLKILFAVSMVFILCTAATQKKDAPQTVYAFGVAASFTDSVVYFTDIQLLDSGRLTKEGFLVGRELYSYQLKNYVEGGGLQRNSTCMIYFAPSKKKIDKELARMLGKYKKGQGVRLETLSQERFKFTKPQE